MYLTKIKAILVAAAAVGLMMSGAGVVTYQRVTAQLSPKPLAPMQKENPTAVRNQLDRPFGGFSEAEVPPMPGLDATRAKTLLAGKQASPKMKDLLRKRYHAAHAAAEARWKEFHAGRGTLDFLLGDSRHLLDAERGLSLRDADHVTALERYVERLRHIEAVNRERYDAGRIAVQELRESEYTRLEGEIWLEELRERSKPAK